MPNIKLIKWIVIAAVIALVSAAWFILPINEWVLDLRSYINVLGWWSIPLFIAIYAIATVCMAPGAPMSITGGLAFGLWGIPIVATGASIGCALAFLVSNRLSQKRQNKSISPKIRAMHDAIVQEDWKIVFLMRLSPLVPFNLQNYFFGMTDIRFSRYLAASILGMLPGTILFVYLGSLGGMQSIETNGNRHDWLQPAFLIVGLILTVLATIWISRKAKQQLNSYGVDMDNFEADQLN